MRLYQQLILFMLAATVLPLAVVGFWLLHTAEAELAHRIGGEQRAVAEAAAEAAAAQVVDAVDAIDRYAGAFDWHKISEGLSAPEDSPERQEAIQERHGVAELLYQQSSALAAVLLVDGDGRVLDEPVFNRRASEPHPRFDHTGLGALARAVPAKELKAGGVGKAVMSEPYLHSPEPMAAVAVGVRLSADEEAPFAVAEIVLGAVDERLASMATPEVGRLDLVDGAGRVVASSEPGRALQPLEPELWRQVGEQLRGQRSQSFPLRLAERMLVSAARVPRGLGMFTVVTVPERTALAPVRAMRRTVLLSVGGALAVLLVLGALFTRRLNARLSEVVAGAEAYSRGELSRRLDASGADELAELAGTFNEMGAELEAARARLTRWNDDLRQKVEEATAELKEAHAQLVEAQKLAAVGQLGAGVAHEINNPLAGILGNAQLMMMDRQESDPDFDTLKKIEQSAKRCKDITQNLLRFAQQQEKATFRAVDLNAVVRDAIALSSSQAQGDGVAQVARLQPGTLMVRGDPGHLSQVLLALLSNARTAMLKSPVKELRVTSREEREAVVVEVQDTGKGIKPEHLSRIFEPFFTTKDVWSNVGLGLSVAYRVMTEHKGKIEVSTELGKGSTFRVRLPKLGAADSPVPTTPSAVTSKSGSLLI